MKEKFILNGETFEAKITEIDSRFLYGRYTIEVRSNDVEDFGSVGVLKPGVSHVNKEEFPHRFLWVDSFYKRKGIASWMFNKLKDLGDILDTECVPEESKLKDFYISKGYKIIREVRGGIDGDVSFVLILNN